MSEPVLTVSDLGVSLSREGRRSTILDHIGFEVDAGEIIAIVGESGSGKSTLGLALQGLLPRENLPRLTGSIRIGGAELVDARPSLLQATRRSVVRAIPQDPMAALDPTMRIRRQIEESTDAPAGIADWLRRTGLGDPARIADSYPHHLSGGERQRVLIAMAMMARPRLLVADEPTTALDVTTQAQILDLLRELARAHDTAIVFITHDLGIAASFADRLVVLYAGRIAEIGNIRDVLRAPSHPYTAGLLAARFDLASDRRQLLPTLPAATRRSFDALNACAYAARCPLAQDDCTARRPPLRPAPSHDGQVACFHSERVPDLPMGATTEPWPAGTPVQPARVLEFRSVGKSFATGERSAWRGRRLQPVLRSITLSIAPGECVALVGESGAGKSTLLRIAAGLMAPDRGEVVRGDDTRPQVVFQEAASALTPWLSIGEQIGERLRPLHLGARGRRLRIADTLELVGLNPRHAQSLPMELSGGQVQRAVIARAVVVPPRLLLCDEPISALDVSLAATMLNLLGSLRKRLGMAMLFVTHDLAAARIIADRIVVLRDGELIEDGDPDTLIAAPRTTYTRSLIAAVPRLPVWVER